MSNPLYYPGAALPPSALYPYNAQPPVNAKNRWSSTCTGPNAYSLRPNRCSTLAGAFCADTYPDFHGQSGFYHPSGLGLNELQYSSFAGPCAPIRVCLDPKALNYDKYGTQHCQQMCRYRKPKACVAEEVREYYGASPACPRDAEGRTAVERLYDTPMGSKGRGGAYYGLHGAFEHDH